MKKLIHILLFITSGAGFIACNGGGNNNEGNNTDSPAISKPLVDSLDATVVDCKGFSNIYISSDDAHAMMARYDSIYKKTTTTTPIVHLKNAEWIDAMIIKSYANFFESNAGKEYDGVRFVNGATNTNTDSRILLVPTKPSTQPGGHHTDVWGKGIILLLSGQPTEYQDWETSQTDATTLKNNFSTIYRTARGLPRDKDPLSESVWMGRCVFLYMRDQIVKSENQTANKIDGVRVYMGAYSKMMGSIVTGQIAPNQSTILLVPTNEGTQQNVHIDRWDLFAPPQSFTKIDVLNHGELCPQICN